MIVATDDERIRRAVAGFGGKAVMTLRTIASGTDRVAEVAKELDADIIVNLQGDEPLIEPAILDLLPELLQQDRAADVATLATPITSLEQWRDPNCVKVVRDSCDRAHVFQPQPDSLCPRRPARFSTATADVSAASGSLCLSPRVFAEAGDACRPEPLEEMEKLEQLRVWRSAAAFMSASWSRRSAASIRRRITSGSWKRIGRQAARAA